MAGVTPETVAIALNRLGLGARPGDWGLAAKDPHGYVARQLAKPKPALLEAPGLPVSDVIFRRQRYDEEMRRRAREMQTVMTSAQAGAVAAPVMTPPAMAAPAMTAPEKMSPGMASPNRMMAPAATKAKPDKPWQDAMLETEIAARFGRWATTDTPFLERLVAFWMNHFAVSASKNGFVTAAIGAFEREAIRPHVLGPFASMLIAVEQHPVMLIYLDNQASIGPDSRAGNNGAHGLNENFARETLELHTLGVDGGYTQADVTAFARILTGWMYSDPYNDDVYGGRFTFSPNRHDPGDVMVLGRTYPEGGREQGEAALKDFARHPSTARHIALKLARAFVSDTPPASLVKRLEAAFRKSDGDLGIVTRTLIESPETWTEPPTKLRSPDEFVVAALRAVDVPTDSPLLPNALSVLGAPLWRAPQPNGYPIDSAAWLAPEGMSMRLDIAMQLSRVARTPLRPDELVTGILGPSVSRETRQAVARAESGEQAIALLLMAPEFQRR